MQSTEEQDNDEYEDGDERQQHESVHHRQQFASVISHLMPRRPPVLHYCCSCWSSGYTMKQSSVH